MSRQHHSPCEEALCWVHTQGAGVHRYMGQSGSWLITWGKVRVVGEPIRDREFIGATLVEAVQAAKDAGPDDGTWQAAQPPPRPSRRRGARSNYTRRPAHGGEGKGASE